MLILFPLDRASVKEKECLLKITPFVLFSFCPFDFRLIYSLFLLSQEGLVEIREEYVEEPEKNSLSSDSKLH